MRWRRRPCLSVVLVVHNMPREAWRTIYSLTTHYQREIDARDYEVIVVDNGSRPPFSVESKPDNVHYFYIEGARPSPVGAMNFGARHARGRHLGLMIDGARIVTPGILRAALRAFSAYGDDAVVTAPAWHIGPDVHSRAIANLGHDQNAEDTLLERIRWTEDGYRLFEISTLAPSSDLGWFGPMAESSSLFLSREAFDRLGGYDERFDLPGGGLGNIDMYIRACELPGRELVVLLGEGTFHQMHGGAATGATDAQLIDKSRLWAAQYQRIRNRECRRPDKVPVYIGAISQPALPSIVRSAEQAMNGWAFGSALRRS
jgi:glycosyltransferase involved in cell wall biosynthesis